MKRKLSNPVKMPTTFCFQFEQCFEFRDVMSEKQFSFIKYLFTEQKHDWSLYPLNQARAKHRAIQLCSFEMLKELLLANIFGL